MNISGETVLVFLYILPGFLSSAILNGITARKTKQGLASIIEALAFSVWIYATTSILCAGDLTILSLAGDGEGQLPPQWELSPGMLGILLLVSICTPLLIGASITHDFHMSLLRSLRLTNKTSRESVWMDVFTDLKSRFVVANLRDGRRIYGWPQYYSNNPEEGMLYIHGPYWIDEDGKYMAMPRHGILLKEDIIESLEFTLIEHPEMHGEDENHG